MRKLRVNRRNHNRYYVEIKLVFTWWSAYVNCDGYFSLFYDTEEEALEAIENYRNRYTYPENTKLTKAELEALNKELMASLCEAATALERTVGNPCFIQEK